MRSHELVRLARDVMNLLEDDRYPDKEQALAAFLHYVLQHAVRQTRLLDAQNPGSDSKTVVFRMEPLK